MQPYGQHFLKNRNILKKICESLNIQSGDIVIEIGPGHGELAEEIVNSPADKIFLIEKDPALIPELKQKFKGRKQISIIEGDALTVLPELLNQEASQKIRLIGNIPYYITGYLLRLIGESSKKPTLSVFMLQKEVAERICALPPRMNRLAASVQIWAEPSIILNVPRGEFNPPPKVDSSVISLETINMEGVNLNTYYKMAHTLFQQPRKTILNNLYPLSSKKGVTKEKLISILEDLDIAPGDRAQNLRPEKILELSTFLK